MASYHAYTVYIDILDDEKDEQQDALILDRVLDAGFKALGLDNVYEVGETEWHDKMEA